MQELTQAELDWIRKQRDGKAVSANWMRISSILMIVSLGCMVAGNVWKFADGDIAGKGLLKESGFVALLGAFLLIIFDYAKYRSQVRSVIAKLAPTLRDVNSELGDPESA